MLVYIAGLRENRRHPATYLVHGAKALNNAFRTWTRKEVALYCRPPYVCIHQAFIAATEDVITSFIGSRKHYEQWHKMSGS